MKWIMLFVCSLCFLSANCSKILLIPMDHPGHVNFLILGGQALLRRGHAVYMFAPIKHRQKILGAGLVPISWKPEKGISVHDDPQFLESLSQTIDVGTGVYVRNTYKMFDIMVSRLQLQCQEFLSNTEIMEQIAAEKFHIALVDSVPMANCFYILPWMHSIRYITITPAADPWAARMPSLPSVEPLQLFAMSNTMSFFERLTNLIGFLVIPYLISLRNDESMIARYAGNRKERSYQEIYSRSEMFLINNDILLLDYPRVSAPHLVFLGGMGGEPPKSLQFDLELFASSADTLVVVSFGSAVELPIRVISKFLAAFAQLDTLHFVMRLTGELPENLSQNVKIMKWLPQNDLLGHPKTKLFITHGGHNSEVESLYHGVPMIVVPVATDGFYNAVRVQKRKYGKIMSVTDETAKMVSTIREVLEDDTYRMNIQRASKIYRSLPQANETLSFWVDHVLKYGSDHISPPYMDMPLYKFFMLDLLLFMTAVLVVGILLCLFFSRLFCCKRLGKRKRVKQE